jgi:hypothetical protein
MPRHLLLALLLGALAPAAVHAEDVTSTITSPDDVVDEDPATATGLPSPSSTSTEAPTPATPPPAPIPPEGVLGGLRDDSPAPIPPRLPVPTASPGDPQAKPKTTPGAPSVLPAPDVENATAWPTGWMHYGTQTATSCACCGCPGVFGMVAIPISAVIFWIPYVGLISSLVVLAAPSLLGCAGFAIAPLVGSGLGVLWSEWLGETRGAMAWPVLASYATEAFSAAIMSVGVIVLGGFSTVFVFSTLNPAFSLSNPTSGEPVFQDWRLWNFNSLGIGSAASFALLLGGVVTAVLAPAVASVLTYDLSADVKEPDDTGFRFPGIFSANGISPEEREQNRLETERDALEREEKLRIQDKKQEEWKLKQKEREKERQKKKGPKAGEPLPVSHPFRY